jgi:hypothetical protein
MQPFRLPHVEKDSTDYKPVVTSQITNDSFTDLSRFRISPRGAEQRAAAAQSAPGGKPALINIADDSSELLKEYPGVKTIVQSRLPSKKRASMPAGNYTAERDMGLFNSISDTVKDANIKDIFTYVQQPLKKRATRRGSCVARPQSDPVAKAAIVSPPTKPVNHPKVAAKPVGSSRFAKAFGAASKQMYAINVKSLLGQGGKKTYLVMKSFDREDPGQALLAKKLSSNMLQRFANQRYKVERVNIASAIVEQCVRARALFVRETPKCEKEARSLAVSRKEAVEWVYDVLTKESAPYIITSDRARSEMLQKSLSKDQSDRVDKLKKLQEDDLEEAMKFIVIPPFRPEEIAITKPSGLEQVQSQRELFPSISPRERHMSVMSLDDASMGSVASLMHATSLTSEYRRDYVSEPDDDLPKLTSNIGSSMLTPIEQTDFTAYKGSLLFETLLNNRDESSNNSSSSSRMDTTDERAEISQAIFLPPDMLTTVSSCSLSKYSISSGSFAASTFFETSGS